MNKLSSNWPSLIIFLVGIVLGLPIVYAAVCHPVSRMASNMPLYRELSKNSFMIMSSKIDLAAGRLIRYAGADSKDQISRIIGLAGDEIRFEDHRLYVNDKVIDEYKNISLPNAKFVVPKDSVFNFPDYISEGSEYSRVSLFDAFVVPVSAITGTILYVFDNETSADKHPMVFIGGAALIILYFFAFFVLRKCKELVYKPIYYVALIAVGFHLTLWCLLSLFGIYLGLWAIVPAIYYIFISWLNFLVLAFAEQGVSVLIVVIFGVLALFSDVTINAKGKKSER